MRLMRLGFSIENTGCGRSTTFHHQIWASLDGQPFPVVACIWKGYATSRYKYQLVPLDRRIARLFHEGSANPNVGSVSGVEIGIHDGTRFRVIVDDIAIPAELRSLLEEVESWGAGRGCRMPSGAAEEVIRLEEWGIIISSPGDALLLLRQVWATFPNSAAFKIQGNGDIINERGLTIAPGIEGRWNAHRPPFIKGIMLSDLKVAHHKISFTGEVFAVAGKLPPPETGFWKAHLWTATEIDAEVYDEQLDSTFSGQVGPGFFWIRHWPRGLD